MKSENRRVVITGAGIISCLGLNRDDVLTSLRQGKSGIRLLPERKALGFQSGLSGTIEGFAPETVLNRKRRKSLPDFGLWAWEAIRQALEQAEIAPDTLSGDTRTGLIFGNDSSAATAVEQVDMLRAAGETRAIGSGHIFRLLNSTISLNISTILGLRGMCWTVSGACASGGMAIGQGAELIGAGRQERVICGGAQEISWQSMCSFDALGAFSRRENSPAEASRPFDRERDGLVPSGGAAAVVLESFATAKDRGAAILGEVVGYGSATDGHHIVIPSGDGLERAMRTALLQAGLSPAAIDLVLAHATSTPAGDRVEARVLRSVFDPGGSQKGPLVCALKGLTGHEFWMAGASQVVYALLMARESFAAGHPNLKAVDPEAAGLRLPQETTACAPQNIVCNSAGFGGTNSCLVIKIIQ